jgi:hypothetical protein
MLTRNTVHHILPILFQVYYPLFHMRSVFTHYDLHDENVVRIPETDALAVIDPYIALARKGTWAAIKLAEVGFPTPPDDPSG